MISDGGTPDNIHRLPKAELDCSFKEFNLNRESKISIESIGNLIKLLESIQNARGNKVVSRASMAFPNGQKECDFEYFIQAIEETISDPEKIGKAVEKKFRLMDLQGNESIALNIL